MNSDEETKYYVPFWIVLEYLDVAPPDPFIECSIISKKDKSFNGPNGSIVRNLCDIHLGKDGLIAYGVPYEYLINQTDLNQWAYKIADWFIAYANSRMSNT